MCACLWAGVTKAAQSVAWAAASLLQPPLHAVLVGLDAAGKTTLLLRLKYGQYAHAAPTVGFNTEKVRSGGAAWLIWDVGGAERVRPLWRSYTRATDALIFVIDSSCPDERLEEARVELHRLAKQQIVQCSTLKHPRPPLLVLANKQDLPAARNVATLTKALGLQDLTESQKWAVAPVCAVTGEGLEEAMIDLAKMVAKTKKSVV